MANRDTVEGRAKSAKGDLKQAAGEITGSEDLKAEGRADKAEGTVQKLFGRLRDVIRGNRTDRA